MAPAVIVFVPNVAPIEILVPVLDCALRCLVGPRHFSITAQLGGSRATGRLGRLASPPRHSHESGAEETVGGGQLVFRVTFSQFSSNITWSLRPKSLDTLFAPNSHASTFHNPFKAPILRSYITLVHLNFNLSMASLIEIARGQATRYKWLICGSMLGCAFGYSFCAGALVLSKV